MNNQQAVVEQIIKNLAFEVEAVPKNITKTTSISQSMPLNVKIRVRKKDESHTKHEVSSASNEITRVPEKIRLVSSDQTIMTFDVFMEAEFEKERSQKPRKHIFDILRPGICLGDTNDDDDSSYVPSSSYSANMTDPSVTTRSDGIPKQHFTLSKNTYQDYTVSTQPGGQKWIFGKCKPGGCLDPPFSEDKYSYKPSTKTGHEQIFPGPNVLVKEKLPDEDIECEANGSKRPSKLNDDDVKSTGRHSSIFDSGLFKKKRKSSDKSTNTKSVDNKIEEPDSILSIYPIESPVNSLSTHSNSIITYPPKLSSDLRISEDKSVKSRGPSEDKSRKSFNDHSEPYFIPPKGVNRIKEKDMIHQKNYPNVPDSGNTNKDSFKMPIPIPIPIPIPLITGQRDLENTAKTGDSTNTIQEFKLIADKDLQDNVNQNEAEIPEEKVREELPTENTAVNVIDSFKKLTPESGSIDLFKQHPATHDKNKINLENDNKSSSDIIPQLDKVVSSKNKDTEKSEAKDKRKPPLPIPIPIPIHLGPSMPNRSDIEVNNTEDKIIPHSIEDKEDSKDINQDTPIGEISRESETIAAVLSPNLEDSQRGIKDTESIEKNYQQSDPVDQKRDPTEIDTLLTKVPTSEGDLIKPESMGESTAEESGDPTKQNREIYEDDKSTNFVDGSSKDYLEDRSDGHMIPDINTNKIKNKTFQNERPALNDSKTSVASIGIDTISNIHADKRLNEEAYINADMSHNLPDNETDNLFDNNSLIYNDKDNIAPSTKPQNNIQSTQIIHSTNDDNDNPYNDGLKRTNNGTFIAAPVIIDKIQQSPYIGPVKEVYSETNLSSEPKVTDPRIDHLDDKSESQIPSRSTKVDDDNMTQSSHELVGIKSVIYDTDDYLPSSSSVKNMEKNSSLDKRALLPSNDVKANSDIISTSPKTSAEIKGSIDDDRKNKRLKHKTRSTSSVLSRITSLNTLKSALKKDTLSIELGFQSYINDKNERILKTFDVNNEPETRFPNDSVTIIKSQIRISPNEIRIPIDSNHDMSIQIKKPTGNQRVSISESGFANMLDNDKKIKQKSYNQTSGGEIRTPEAKVCEEIVEGDVMDDNVLDLYEHELVPLQLIIKNLRDEIDVLAAQQTLYRDKIFCPKKAKFPRLVHSNKKCFGCPRK